MGSYKEVSGDLIDLTKKGHFDVIGHGCNCFKVMGAGIAYKLRAAFPEIYEADVKFPFPVILRLGLMSYAKVNGLAMCNLYSQFEPGRNLDTVALRSALKLLAITFPTDLKIGLPQIGCGIAGGDWEEVKLIIQEELKDHDVTIVIYNG